VYSVDYNRAVRSYYVNSLVVFRRVYSRLARLISACYMNRVGFVDTCTESRNGTVRSLSRP
jgi:hypothetical protein